MKALHEHPAISQQRDLPARKVVLVDFYDEGHHRSFVNLYAQVLAESGQEVVVMCPFPVEDIDSYLHRRVSHVMLGNSKLYNVSSFFSSLRLLWSISRIIRHVDNINIVFFLDELPYMQKWPGLVIDVLFPFPWGVLNMHPILEEKDNSILRRLKVKFFGTKSISEKYLSSRYLKFVAFLSERAPQTYKQYFPHHVFAWLPDASHERLPSKPGRIAAEIQEASKGRTIVTIAGSLERRKGLYEMMYLAMNADPSRYFFAFCGKPCWETFEDFGRLFQEFRALAPMNCYFHLEFISDLGDENEFDSIIQFSDIIFSAMDGYEHSSNVLTKAAHMRRPVIVSGRGICALRTMKYRLGAVIPEKDVFCSLRALESLTATTYDGAWDDYKRDFSVLRLSEALVKLFERIGAEPKKFRA